MSVKTNHKCFLKAYLVAVLCFAICSTHVTSPWSEGLGHEVAHGAFPQAIPGVFFVFFYCFWNLEVFAPHWRALCWPTHRNKPTFIGRLGSVLFAYISSYTVTEGRKSRLLITELVNCSYPKSFVVAGVHPLFKAAPFWCCKS